MGRKTVVETFYGKVSKYEVIKDTGTFSTDFYVHKDGKHDGAYSSLEAAVAAARKKAGK